MKTKVHYALRRRETNTWLTYDGYERFKESSEAIPVSRLATAMSYRLRALTSKQNFGIIDIHEIMISVDVRDAIPEDPHIQDRLLGLMNATKRFRFNFQPTVPDYATIAEQLMRDKRKPENANMRYIAIFLVHDRVTETPNVDLKQMKQIARFARKGGVFLIQDTHDLAAMKLFDGFTPSCVYDFVEARLIEYKE